MKNKIRIVSAQINVIVGDIEGNLAKITEACHEAHKKLKADMIVFPELALTGYPPEDLLVRKDFQQQVQQALKAIAKIPNIDIVIGYPDHAHHNNYNGLAVFSGGKLIANYHKRCLPNYGVFDEKRYFHAGRKTCVINYKGMCLGFLICEDLWHEAPANESKEAGAEIIIAINASPFDMYKLQQREKIIQESIQRTSLPVIYNHLVGGQDELVFDGRSMVIDSEGEMTHLSPAFEECLMPIDLVKEKSLKIIPGMISARVSDETRTYNALVLALRDYINKNKFSQAILGLSGGIDSALVAVLAVDALGKDRVHAVLMPSRYTSNISNEDALKLVENLGIRHSFIPIEPTYDTVLNTLENDFKGTESGVAEENIQARIRGLLLMALSNKFGSILLTTGNKSELAVGYATLYGDMAGGFAVLKDVYKTWVYRLARYRNALSYVIPSRTIERAPTAELAHNQVDEDTLPPYEILDEILRRYVENDQTVEEIVHAGIDHDTVIKIIGMVDRSEYKRRQAPLGVKITSRAFGRDRRYPITNRFRVK